MKPTTLRTYVWSFCLYLFAATQWIFHRSRIVDNTYVDHSFVNVFSSLFGPALMVFAFISIFSELTNTVEKCVAVLTAISFALILVFNLHTLEYLPFGIPHWLSGSVLILATIVFGYRIDQLLKEHGAGIDFAESPLETGEDE